MPTCDQQSLSLTFTNQVLEAILNGVRFFWPIAKWLPWNYAWQIFGAWILYVTLKVIIVWLPKIVQWIIGIVQWIVEFIGGIIPG